MNDQSSDDGYNFELRQPSRGITGLEGILQFGNYRPENDAIPSRKASADDLDELFANEANFEHDFELPSFEPNFGKRESCGPLAQYVWQPTIPRLAEKQPVAKVQEQRVVKQSASPFINSNSRPIDMNTNFSSHLPFVKVLVNHPNEPEKTDDTKLSLRRPKIEDVKLVKAKSLRSRAKGEIEFEEESEEDATVTTECSDGPGCRVPWLMPKKASAGPLGKISSTKSLQSKRIAKAEEKAGAKLLKRAYKKRVIQVATADDAGKSTNQESTANAPQNENPSPTKNELAPPFAADTASGTAEEVAPGDSEEGPEVKDTYRMKLNRYWKKKYSVKTKRHIYKARQQVAERRLRIEGRFVTKKQAYEILGMDEGSLTNADTIQELLTQHANDKKKINSNIQASKSGGRVFKVQNLQALL